MKRYFLFVFFFLCGELSAQEPENKKDVSTIVTNVYGELGLNLPKKDLDRIASLLKGVLDASLYQQEHIAQNLIARLQLKYAQNEQVIESEKKKEARIPLTQFFTSYALKQQIKHFEDFVGVTDTKLTTPERISGTVSDWFEDTLNYISSWFGTKKPDTVQQLSDELMWYITFERETILFNYNKLLKFIVAKKETPLPLLLDFWNTRELIERIKKRSKQVTPDVEIQAWGLIIAVGAQALVMFGGEAAIKWIDQQDEEKYKALLKQQTKISNQNKAFQDKLQKSTQKILGNIAATFGAAQTKLQAEYKATNQQLQDEIAYLNQAVDLPLIKQYIANTPPYIEDQYFANAPMLTPKGAYPWYNVYQIPGADWEFNGKTNSFWQYGLVPFPAKLFWDLPAAQRTINDNDPAANHIFAEYITGKTSYDIEIECRLISCKYPFFAGIMFNKGRWISGDPERTWQYRLLGLYGTQNNPKNEKTRAINLAFAQQILQFKKGSAGKKTEKIISPLEQITKDKTKPINFALPAADVTNLRANPQTYIFKITTQPTSAKITVLKKEKNTTQPLYSTTVSNLPSYVYMFHGIGLVTSGCQAQFTITKPTELVFSKKQIDDFEKQHAATQQKQGT